MLEFQFDSGLMFRIFIGPDFVSNRLMDLESMNLVLDQILLLDFGFNCVMDNGLRIW